MSTNLPHPSTLRTCLLLLLAANPCAASNKQTPVNKVFIAMMKDEPIHQIQPLIQDIDPQKDKDDATLLFKTAIATNKAEVVNALISHGIDINKKADNKSQLFHALRSGV